MRLFRRWTQRLKRRTRAEGPVGLATVDGLTDRLDDLRGDNVTAMGAGSGASTPQSADRVQHMANAARDARYVDRSNEDDRLKQVEEYRSID